MIFPAYSGILTFFAFSYFFVFFAVFLTSQVSCFGSFGGYSYFWCFPHLSHFCIFHFFVFFAYFFSIFPTLLASLVLLFVKQLNKRFYQFDSKVSRFKCLLVIKYPVKSLMQQHCIRHHVKNGCRHRAPQHNTPIHSFYGLWTPKVKCRTSAAGITLGIRVSLSL